MGIFDDIIDETIKEINGGGSGDMETLGEKPLGGWKDTGSKKEDKVWDTGEGWSSGETEDLWRS